MPDPSSVVEVTEAARGAAGSAGAAGPPGGVLLGLATAVAALSLATAAASQPLFNTSGYRTVDDGGQATYRVLAPIEADKPGMLTSADGVRLTLAEPRGIRLEMFDGVRGDNSPGARARNNAALAAALAYEPHSGTGMSPWERPVRRLNGLDGDYWFSQNVFNAKHAIAIFGSGGWAGIGGEIGTRFIGPKNWKGIVFHQWNTIDETTEGTPTTEASGSLVVGIGFVGNDAAGPDGTITDGYGLWARCPIQVIGCSFTQLYDGWRIWATAGGGGSIEGQASGCFGLCNSFMQIRHDGLSIKGADASVGRFIHHNYIAIGRFGVFDIGFLSNSHDGGHWRDCGNRTDYFPETSLVWYAGTVYHLNETCMPSPEPASVGNPPTSDATIRAAGTPDVNPYWTAQFTDAGPFTEYPSYTTWTGTFQKGGPILLRRGKLGGAPYAEGAQPPAHGSSLSSGDFGFWGCGYMGFGVVIEDGTLMQNEVGNQFNTLRRTRFSSEIADKTIELHNDTAAAGSIPATMRLSQGFEADGVTPRRLAALGAIANGASTTAAQAYLEFWLRTGGLGDWTNVMELSSAYLVPVTNLSMYLGLSGQRWLQVYAQYANLTSGVIVAGDTVVTGRGAAVANASNAAAAPTQAEFNALVATLNTALQRLRDHGLIAS